MCAGNGSLMRVLPLGLAYWRCEENSDEGENGIWREYVRRSSETTHPNNLKMCVEACEPWAGAIVKIMRTNARTGRMNKLDLLQHFATFPYTNETLRAALALPVTVLHIPTSEDLEEVENHHNSTTRSSNSSLNGNQQKMNPLNLPTRKELPSSRYVLNNLVAVLYWSNRTCESGRRSRYGWRSLRWLSRISTGTDQKRMPSETRSFIGMRG